MRHCMWTFVSGVSGSYGSRSYTIAAEVMLADRNIRISGNTYTGYEKESFGGRVLVGGQVVMMGGIPLWAEGIFLTASSSPISIAGFPKICLVSVSVLLLIS